MNLLLLSIVLALVSAANASKIVFCYFESWANEHKGNGKFTPDDINPHLCTHIGYSFFGVSSDGTIKSLAPATDFPENSGLGYVQKVVALKKVNPNLKVIASVGGWSEGSKTFSSVAADPVKRKKFVDSSLAFVLQYGFDGLDIDWEYPTQRGGVPSDRANFVTLLKELNTALKTKNKLLSIAVGATADVAIPSYDITGISKNLDFINLMTYDLYGPWAKTTGINAPLSNSGEYSVDKAVMYWLNQGAPPQQLILGLPFYGNSFTLANSANHGIGAPATGEGTGGSYIGEGGTLGYNEICINKSWNVVYDNTQQVPYAFSGNQWVGFDNVESIGEKVKYALRRNLGGVMIWSIDTDDFRGDCGAGKYPLLTKAFSINE